MIHIIIPITLIIQILFQNSSLRKLLQKNQFVPKSKRLLKRASLATNLSLLPIFALKNFAESGVPKYIATKTKQHLFGSLFELSS